MIINKFYEKLYKELINKLESDYILIPNTPENRKAINNTLTTVPCTVKSLEKDSKIFKALSNKKAKAKQLSIVPKISKTLSLIIIATLICMPFNTINTLPTPTYHPTVQVSILDISDGSSHQKGKNKLSEIQEQRNPKNYKKKVATNTYNTYKKQNKFHLTLSTKKATQLLSTFKKFFLKTKNTYDNLSDAYDVISTLFVLISTVKESIRSKKLK